MSPIVSPSRPGRRRKALLVTLAAGVAGALAFAGPVTAVLAAGDTGQPTVAVSKTVKADLESDGSVDVARLFTQVQASGNGRVRLIDPTSTDNLRNLNGFGAPSTKGGKATYNFSVDGTENLRTVASLDKDKALPVDVKVTYTLDGRRVKPADLAGKSGKLEISYDIKNTTAEPTEISYPDGLGKTVTETVDIVTPYVGQLALDLPKSFDNVKTADNRADQAGNGRGGRLVTWTMVLFEPIGQVEQKFGFTADVDNAVLPEAHMQIVPVSPENHPELKFGQDGFSNGAKTGRTLTAGASEIDANVLKLRDGASQLLDGLTQLQNGAVQLSTGLADGVPTAINGGNQLAAGADKAADGAGQIADGASQLEVGNKQLADGLVQLAGGAGQLRDGSHQLRDGVNQLALGFNNPNSSEDLIDGSQALASGLGLINAGVAALPTSIKTNAGYQQLKTALSGIAAAVGVRSDSPVNPQTLNAAINAIEFGLTNPGCVRSAPLDPANPCGVKEALNTLQTQLSTPGTVPAQDTSLATLATLNTNLNAAGGREALEYLAGPNGLDCGQASPLTILGNPALTQQCTKVTRSVNNIALGPGNPAFFLTTAEPEVTNNVLETIIAKLGVASDATTAVGALALLQQKIDAKLPSGAFADGTFFFGLERVRGGLTNPNCNLANPTNPANPCGIKEVAGLVNGGIDQLVAGISANLGAVISPASTGAGDLADGIGTAAVGVSRLQGGANQLADGLDQVGAKVPAAVAGAKKLATGSAKLSHGSQQLSDALGNQLAPGAHQLADGLTGLNAAKDGSQQLADGLGQARDGGKQIVDGAGRLSAEGTSQLVAAGQDTSKTFGKEYATMQALNKKGVDNAMPIGTPTGSDDNRGAYDITIAGVGHQGAGNAGRGLAGIAILAIGAAAATVLRGRFA